MNGNTPNYIKTLLMPSAKNPQGRRVWSIDLETVWLPLFTATNTMGDTAIPHDALGAPIRLATNKDGSIKFGRNGKPVTRVVKEISQSVALVRENFVATLKDYAQSVAEAHPDEFNAQVALAREAGAPIMASERDALDKAIKAQIAAAMAEAEKSAPKEVADAAPRERERELAGATA